MNSMPSYGELYIVATILVKRLLCFKRLPYITIHNYRASSVHVIKSNYNRKYKTNVSCKQPIVS